MGLFTPMAKEIGWQLYFRDDGSFIFRKLEIEDGWLVEKDGNGKGVRAFMQRSALLKRFDGYKNIPPGNVTLGFGRDILFDKFNQLQVTEKPKKGEGIKSEWMRKLAAAIVYRHEVESKPVSSMDKMVIFLGALAIILGLALAAKAVWS